MFLVRKHTSKTFIYWTVVPFVSLHPEYGFLNVYIGADAVRRDAVFVAATWIHR